MATPYTFFGYTPDYDREIQRLFHEMTGVELIREEEDEMEPSIYDTIYYLQFPENTCLRAVIRAAMEFCLAGHGCKHMRIWPKAITWYDSCGYELPESRFGAVLDNFINNIHMPEDDRTVRFSQQNRCLDQERIHEIDRMRERRYPAGGFFRDRQQTYPWDVDLMPVFIGFGFADNWYRNPIPEHIANFIRNSRNHPQNH